MTMGNPTPVDARAKAGRLPGGLTGQVPGAIVFDLDGTLVDSLEDLGRSVNRVLAEAGGAALAIDVYRGLVGRGAEHLVREALRRSGVGTGPEAGVGADEVGRWVERFGDVYREHQYDHTGPYPGVVAMLDTLATRWPGVARLVVSNKPDAHARAVVGRLFGDRFDAVRGHRPGTAPKPEPASTLETLAAVGVGPASAWFVGDMDVDVATARAAGCRPIGVAWGFRGAAELRELGVGDILDRPGDLMGLIETR